LTNVLVVVNDPAPGTPVFGPVTLAPGGSANFQGSYTAPSCCCEFTDTVAAVGNDQCTGKAVSATSSTVCPLLSTPGIMVSKSCPSTTPPAGSTFAYTGTVINTGDVVLTNVIVVSSQPAANTPVIGPLTLAPNESKSFSGSYTVAAGSNPALDTVTATGVDICLARTVSSQANCSGTISGQPGPLVIHPPVVVDGWLRIIWASNPGTVYCLQSKNSLNDPEWTTMPGNITATGPTAFAEDPIDATQHRLYRIMVVKQ
jgi:uncharacterized repeat protein (TIGR01451 family)